MSKSEIDGALTDLIAEQAADLIERETRRVLHQFGTALKYREDYDELNEFLPLYDAFRGEIARLLTEQVRLNVEVVPGDKDVP